MPKKYAKSFTQEELERQILETAPEISIWMIAFGCLTTMADARDDYLLCNIGPKVFYPAFNAAYAELIKTAAACDRFGIILPVIPEKNYRSRINEDYCCFIDARFSGYFWKWYNWWADHLLTLNPVDKQKLLELGQRQSRDLADYHPPGDWIDYRRMVPKVLDFTAPLGAVKAG